MSRHFHWRDVPLSSVVAAIYDLARDNGGRCTVYLHGPVLRIEREPFDVRRADDHCGEFRATDARANVERRLLTAFVLAVAE